MEQQQRSSLIPQQQQTTKQLQEKISQLKKELDAETKNRILLQEKLTNLEATQSKLKDQAKVGVLGGPSLSDQKNEKIGTIETIVRMEKGTIQA
jgi:hypothetical protein